MYVFTLKEVVKKNTLCFSTFSLLCSFFKKRKGMHRSKQLVNTLSSKP